MNTTLEEVKKVFVDILDGRMTREEADRLDPIQDIQVLAPMKKGPIGTENLNQVLQQALNPQEDVVFHGAYRFSPGDKVMQIRNNYTKEVYNGDIGQITKIDREEQIHIIWCSRKYGVQMAFRRL